MISFDTKELVFDDVGAHRILNNDKFAIHPQYVKALKNLPEHVPCTCHLVVIPRQAPLYDHYRNLGIHMMAIEIKRLA